MRPRWKAVSNALASLAVAIPDGDEFEVRQFAGESRVLVSASMASPALKRSWQRTLLALPAPTGTSTDLGLAAQVAIEAIRDADVDQLQYVVFLTDGRHEPASPSRYAGDAANGAWADLALEAAAIERSRPMQVFIIRLDEAAESGRIKRVFTEAEEIDALSSGDLARWFDRTARQIAVKKLEALVRSELARPLARLRIERGGSIHAGRPSSVSAEVVAARRIVRTDVDDSTAYRTPSYGQIAVDAHPLPSDGGVVRMRWIGPPMPIWTPAFAGVRAVVETLTVASQIGPREELDRLGIARRGDSDRIVVEGDVSVRGALPDWAWWMSVTGLALFCLWSARRVRWAMHRPRLSGSVIVRSRTGSEAGVTHKLGDRPGASFTVPDRDGRPMLVVEARSERGRTVLLASPLVPDLELNGKPAPLSVQLITRLTFRSGDVEISFLPS